MKQQILLFAIILGLSNHSLFSQQIADEAIEITIEHSTYSNNGPTIAIDGGHNNFHKLDGRFEPFARLMRLDGYQVEDIQQFNPTDLKEIDMLVISNPLNKINIGNWKNPCPSAFTAEEIKNVKTWVKKGGRLLLIADHMPFGGAAQKMAQAFGFDFANGFAMAPKQIWPPDTFQKSDGTLKDHPITKDIPSLAAFTGSAIKAPKKATILAIFPEGHEVLLPKVAWQFTDDTPKESGSRYAQGAIMEFGKGKIGVFSEAAMFSAQIANNGKTKVGFNANEAKYNQAFILNLMHWLTGK